MYRFRIYVPIKNCDIKNCAPICQLRGLPVVDKIIELYNFQLRMFEQVQYLYCVQNINRRVTDKLLNHAVEEYPLFSI